MGRIHHLVLPAAWIAIDLLLLGIMAYVVFFHWHPRVGAREESTESVPSPTAFFAERDAGVLANTVVQRPIFHADRTFVVPKPAAQAVVAPPTPNFIFAGYMALPGKKSTAMILNRDTGKTARAKVGDSVEGWNIIDIGRQSAVAEREGYRITVTPQGTAPPQPSGG